MSVCFQMLDNKCPSLPTFPQVMTMSPVASSLLPPTMVPSAKYRVSLRSSSCGPPKMLLLWTAQSQVMTNIENKVARYGHWLQVRTGKTLEEKLGCINAYDSDTFSYSGFKVNWQSRSVAAGQILWGKILGSRCGSDPVQFLSPSSRASARQAHLSREKCLHITNATQPT